MLIGKLSKIVQNTLRNIKIFKKESKVPSPYSYNSSPLLFNHTLQSLYQLYSKPISVQYQREKIFFPDGGHISLDWVNKYQDSKQHENTPIIFIMHGMTGGSDCRYMQIMSKLSKEKGFTCVCMNSRGFNSIMTSPVPFVGIDFHQLEQTLQRVKTYYPKRPIHMVGMSLGGNYLMRFLLKYGKNHPFTENVKTLSLCCPPFDVKYVIHNMNKTYQKYFTRYYIDYMVVRHEEMSFWWKNGIVDYDSLQKSSSLKQFHQRITQKIVGQPVDQIFDKFKIQPQEIQNFPFSTLLITADDDQMVLLESVPIEHIRKNKNIKFCLTKKGAHMCWFEGWIPERWYPKPIFQFIQDISQGRRVQWL